MPGKKGDSKSAAKKGGKAEPEKSKGKEEEKKGKDDKKGAKDDQKGGKDDKKKGKEDPKGKGKDYGKKGKDKGKGAKVVSESEEVSDAEPIEDDEELSEEESDEDTYKHGHGKAGPKGKVAKGKSKSKHAASDEEEDEEEEEEDEEDEENEESEEDRKGKKKSKDAHKSKSKLEAEGTKKKAKKKDEVPPVTAPEPAKKLFGFPGIGKSSKKRLKSTSRLFLGLGKQKSFVVRKKRRKSVLKNAPRLLMRFKASKKKKKEKEQNDQLGRKPSYMLLKIGGNKPAEKKSGLFKGLFRKKNADDGSNFKNQSLILGKVAGATNWLTKKFLSTKLKQRPFDRNQGRWGKSSKKRFPGGSRQTSMQGPHGHHNYAYEHDFDDYDYNNQGRMRNGAFNRQSFQGNPNWYEDPDDFYEAQSHDPGYYEFDDEYYNPHMDIQNGGEYYENGMGFYNTYSAQHQMGYYPEQMEYYDQQHLMDPYYSDNIEYYDENQYLMEDCYEPYEDETEFYDQGQFDYYDDSQEFYDNPYGEVGVADPYMIPYGAYEDPYLQDYQLNYSESGVNPYLDSSYNMYQPYCYTMHEVMEGDEFNDVSVEPMDLQGDMFRVPRPQVSLFGKERIPVEFPPFPPQYYPEEMSQVNYKNVPFIPDARMDGAFPAQEMLHPGLPQVPTPTAMLIKHANSPQGFISPNAQSPYMSPMAQGAFPPSPTPSRRSMGMMASPVPRPLSPMLAKERFTEPLMDMGPPPLPMQKQSFHGSPQPSIRRRQSPSPQPYIRGFGVRDVPPPPLRGMSSPHIQRPPSPFGERKVSPPASPAAFSHFQPQASFVEARSSPIPMVRRMPKGSFRTGPPAAAHGSIRKQSLPHSPRASIRRPSPVSSPAVIHRPFGARKLQGSTSPPRQISPSTSPQMGRRPLGGVQQMDSNRPRSPFAANRSSPAPSRRSFAVGSESPQPPLPAGQRSPSPSFSHRSTHLMRNPLPFGTSGGQLRGMGRPNIPMGTVKPSLGQMGRFSAPAKNMSPSRASVRSNSSVMAQDIRASPKLPGHHPGMVIMGQRHFIPPGQAGSSRNTQRPVGLGRPLMARQSLRRRPPSPQPSLKHIGPISPQPSVRHFSRPSSPLPTIHRGSPLPRRSPSPRAPPITSVSSPFQNVQMSEASSYPIAAEFDQMISVPQSPMITNALQNPSISHASYNSPFLQPVQPNASEVIGIQQFPGQPSSPQLLNELQNPNLLNTMYTSVPQVTPVLHTVLQQSPETLASPVISNALQNSQVTGASFISPLQRPGSPLAPVTHLPSSPLISYGPETVLGQSPGQAASPTLTNAIQNPYLHNASYKTVLQMPASPYSPVVSQYDYIEEPGPGPLLTNALQNPNVRNATYRTHLQRRGSRYAPKPRRSPVLSNALQNQEIRKASYQTHISHPSKAYGYVPTNAYAQSPILSDALHNPQVHGATYNLPGGTLVHGNQMVAPTTSPMLTNALQNRQVRNASYRLSDGTLINVDPYLQQPLSPNISNALGNTNLRYASYRLPDGTIITTDSLQQQQQQPSSPNLASALQNPNLKNASYRLPPDNSLISESHQKSVSPNLSRALRNNSIRNASYRLPDGTVIFTEQQVEPTSPALSNALQNPIIRNASYRLGDGTIIFPDYNQSKSTSPNLANALQNTQMRNASYRLPDGSIITTQLTTPSPNLANALQNPNMRHASYRLPDGNIISANPVHSPSLSNALKNANIKKASFRLPDESIFLSSKPTSPNLAAALKNENLRKASYRLPGNSLISATPHTSNLKLSQALLNKNLRNAMYRLPDESVLRQGFAVSSTPQLRDALKNTGLKNASYQLPSALSTVTASGLIIGPDGRYAIVTPQRKGPEEHWAMNARDRQNAEDVWAAERVLPHGTVQNLTKWSMYRDENMMDHLSLPPVGSGSREGEVQWVPDREGEPTGQWYDKVTQFIYFNLNK